MKRNNIITLIIIFTFVIVLFSLYHAQKIEKEIIPGVAPVISPPAPGESLPQLVPSRPEDYGMIVIDDTNRPKTQKEWDNLLSTKIRQLKSEFSPETWDKVQEMTKGDPKKTEEKIKQIDENIKKTQELLSKDPNNQELKDKIERLMMLKSIAKGLSE